MVSKFFKRFYLLIVLTFLYAPIVTLIVYSFNESKTRAVWSGFSLKWYGQLFQNPEIMQALYVTLTIAVLASCFATLIGTLGAIGIYGMNKMPKAIFLNVSYLPILTPEIVTGISLMIMFTFVQLPLGFFTMLLAHITFNIPYVLYSVLPKLKQMNPHTYEAALDLGSTPSYALRRIIVPEILPGIITGAILSFTLSLDDFVISFFTTQDVQNLSILVFSMARRGVSPTINALSALMFVTIILLLFIVNRRASLVEG